MLSDFISLIFPQNCSGCNAVLIQSEKGICSSCFIEIERLRCTDRNKKFVFGRTEVEEYVSAFDLTKDSALHKILHNIKYRNDRKSANILGVELGKRLKQLKFNEKIECIIPVPISKKKLKRRKFNQSEEIARGINQVMAIPVETNWLLRKNNLKSQIFSNRYQRAENVKEEYYLNKKKTLQQKRLLIIDDIVTTGATIQSCLEAINKEEYNSIYIASVAKTQ